MKKVVYIGFAFSHHKGTHAGYHHLKEYLEYDYMIDCQREIDFLHSNSRRLLDRILRKLYRAFFGDKTPFAIMKCIFLS